MAILLGLDIGSSSVKASLLDGATGVVLAQATSPDVELPILAKQIGWAEQEPELWWEHCGKAIASIRAQNSKALLAAEAIGISYQMHGLVLVGKNDKALRPSIIWCDSRAVPYGEKAFATIGKERALSTLLNSPGNFTAAKLAWVIENEPAVYEAAEAFMLPGDFIALKLTGERATTVSGLSEGILWDFETHGVAESVLGAFGIAKSKVPKIVPTFGVQGRIRPEIASTLGLKPGIPVSYRAGDQPNNAFSLNVLEPGECATTAGTSGVVYGVGDKASADSEQRVNTFVHVNNGVNRARYGTLLCVNGTGILNSWLKREVMGGKDYEALNQIAASVAPGAEGLTILPYGNGAERSLGNRSPGAEISGLNFNTHTNAHLLRAAQEGIVFALRYGLEVMRGMGIKAHTVRAGYANMFLSPLFREIFAATTGVTVELYSTDGAQGAARGAGIGAGFYASPKEAFEKLAKRESVGVNKKLAEVYEPLYQKWRAQLEKAIA